jgi:hypothetical protein
MTAAARNPNGGGGMGAGLGMGMGMAMAGQMATQTGPWGAAPQPAAAAPPPPPAPSVEKVWHVADGTQTKGPYSRADMGRMLMDGSLTRETFVWAAGQDGWKTAEDIDELATLFTIMPPPPPGA